MPIVDLEKPSLTAAIDTPKGFAVTPGEADMQGQDSPVERPAWSSTIAAAFRQDNTVGSYFANEARQSPLFEEPGFNPWEAIKGTKYEPHWRSFVDVRNSRAADDMKRQVDQEEEDRKTLSAAPWYQSLPAQIAAGVIDLPTLIPGGAFVKGAQGGFSVGRSALNVGIAAGIGSAAQETALHATQQERGLGESGVNIGASVLLGGLLGAGGAKLLSHAEWKNGVAALERELTGGAAQPEPWSSAPRDRSAYIDDRKYQESLSAPYFDGENKIASSREVPFSGDLPQVGSWRISHIKGNYGHEIERLTTVKLDDLDLPEVREGKLDPTKRGDDERYAEWLKQGLRAPPIEIVETEAGKLRVSDGHRRALAAKLAGQDEIEAWVSYAVPTGKIDSSGKPMKTGLTYELAHPGGATGAPAPASVGAAANEPTNIEGNSIAGRMASTVAASTKQLNPLLRILQSDSPVAREVGTQLFENPLYLKKNMDGIASQPAAETLMKEWNGGLVRALEATDDAFSEYRKGGGALGRDEFRQAVGRAMRRGDQDADPFVTKVAQSWRSQVFDPLKEAAIKAGLLPEDVNVETAASYFSRMWNRNKLIAREGEFKGVVQKWVEEQAPTWQQQFDKETERSLTPLQREIDDLEMAKLRRSSEAAQRDNEVQTGEFSEDDIRRAIGIVQGGAPKPQGVKTLTQFIHSAGGLFDQSGELRHMGITNKARPGFVKNTLRDAQDKGGGWTFDDMARHAWENGYFPYHGERPTVREFLDALADDFNKRRAVVRESDHEAYRLQELVNQLDQDLSRLGIDVKSGVRFSTSEEVKGMIGRVYKAMDAQADSRIADLKKVLAERQAERNVDREARFGDVKESGRDIADQVFNTLTGKTGEGVRPEFITVNARGPLKERTFNIPDHLVEDFLEHDVDLVGRRYSRIMGADVELAHRFGTPDMKEQIGKVREDYARLRQGITDEKELTRLGKAESADVADLEAVRDLLRGTKNESPVERNYGRIVRVANHINYIRVMGEAAIASLAETVRPAMVHGLMPYLGTVTKFAADLKTIKMSVAEAKLAGNIAEDVLAHRLATLADIADPYSSRGPIEAFLENMTNVASKWNGLRILTDMQKSIGAVMTQNRILQNAEKYAGIKKSEKAYMAYLGMDEGMAERIAKQFAEHGETINNVRVANTENWTDPVARRTYRAAVNKDVDSIITTKGVADVPLLASTSTGKMLLQFKSFFLAAHQRVLLRGLQESQARFVGGTIAMTGIGMFATYLKALSGNRTDQLSNIASNPGWWIAEGLDKGGPLTVPMELANAFEKATGVNPIKSPIRAFDENSRISQRIQNRSLMGTVGGPSVGLVDDFTSTLGIPYTMYKGEQVSQAQKNAAERLLPFNSYAGMRQILRYVVNPPNQ